MKAELLIRNGRVFDPAEKIDMIGDVAVAEGKILAIGPQLSAQAATVLDASGCLVVPGLIDIHGHLYENGTPNGLPVDLAAIPMGITAIADAGSSGVANYPNLLHALRSCKARARLMLNVSACGIIMPSQFPEPLDPKTWDMGLFRKAQRVCGEDMIALKLRVQKSVVGNLGLEPLKAALKCAEELGTKVVVHVTDGAAPMGEIASMLRPGDVFCHVYHGTGYTILDENGMVDRQILQARERGVVFDAAAGRGNFSFEVARKAIAQGFLPDSISTDVTLQNWNHPFAGQLPTIMSKYLQLGMSVEDIILRVTAKPAEQFGMPGLGTLKEGTPADITLLKLEEHTMEYKDKFGNAVTCDQLFIPKATVINGEIQYRAVDCGLTG